MRDEDEGNYDSNNWVAIVIISVIFGVFIFIVLVYVCCYATRPLAYASTPLQPVFTVTETRFQEVARAKFSAATGRQHVASAGKKQ